MSYRKGLQPLSASPVLSPLRREVESTHDYRYAKPCRMPSWMRELHGKNTATPGNRQGGNAPKNFWIPLQVPTLRGYTSIHRMRNEITASEQKKGKCEEGHRSRTAKNVRYWEHRCFPRFLTTSFCPFSYVSG